MGQALLAGARLALQQDITVGPGDPGRFMLQRQEFRRFAHHAVQAVPAAVTGSVGDCGFQVFNRHGQDSRSFHVFAYFHRQRGRYVFIRPVLGDPGHFAAVDGFSCQRLTHRDMLIVQEHIRQGIFPVQAFLAVFIAILNLFVTVQPVDAHWQLVQDHLLHVPVDQHLQILFHGILHGQQKR